MSLTLTLGNFKTHLIRSFSQLATEYSQQNKQEDNSDRNNESIVPGAGKVECGQHVGKCSKLNLWAAT